MRHLVPTLLLAACANDYKLTGEAVNVNPEDVTECGFTRVEATAFYRYDCNPVFTTTDEDWAKSMGSTTFHVTEVVGHPFYQLWYTAYENTTDDWPPYNVGYAASPDGTNFTPHPRNPVMGQPEKGEFDYDYMSGLQVVWDPNEELYVMIYQGINDSNGGYGMGLATSPDGIKWTRHAKNPVYDLHEAVGSVQNWCWPLGLDLGEQGGYTGYIAGSERGGNNACEAYRLNASSLGDWQPSEKKALAAGENGEWDDCGFAGLAIAGLGDTRYLFYSGFGYWTRSGNYQVATNLYLGVAEMGPGEDEWQKWGDYVPVHNTDDGRVSAVAARTVATRIHLWITDDYDGQQAVGYFLYDPDRAAEEDAGGGDSGE
ncbi:MAG: hypothetical protein FJ102_04170 [Deltaproteobacteria bacterium]|nr:hypothetical protein [Deltaproteobacteria bacterium]